MKKLTFVSGMVLFALVSLTSCSRDNQNATLQIRLTDAPADYDQVLIDIEDVQIHASDDENQGSWQSLDIKKGVYNLLDFRNGLDTLLASVELPSGKISQMRLILGSENKIKTNGTIYNLATPSALQSGLKFNIHATLTEGATYRVWIDFDAGRSILKKGNGDYSLKPVIRTFTKATSGVIKGVVSPADASPYIMTIADGDTIGTMTGSDGSFLLRGVPEGTYTVFFQPDSLYLETSVGNIAVNTGEVTKMDTVFLSKR